MAQPNASGVADDLLSAFLPFLCAFKLLPTPLRRTLKQHIQHSLPCSPVLRRMLLVNALFEVHIDRERSQQQFYNSFHVAEVVVNGKK